MKEHLFIFKFSFLNFFLCENISKLDFIEGIVKKSKRINCNYLKIYIRNLRIFNLIENLLLMFYTF